MLRNTIFILMLLLVVGISCGNDADDLITWYYDVYTGRHFNDLSLQSTSTDNVVVNPAVLILFAPDCYEDAINFRDELRPYGPKDKYLTLAMHDYVTYPYHIWYEFDEIDNLYERYMMHDDNEPQCLEVLFFGKGSRLSDPEIYDFSIGLFDWVWERMLITIKVLSGLDSVLKLYTEGQGDPFFMTDLGPWQTLDMNIHVSMYLTVYDQDDNLIFYELIEHNSIFNNIEITEATVSEFAKSQPITPEWLSTARVRLDEESEKKKHLQWILAENILLTFKQPVLIPKFTETGYKVITIPPNVYQTLRTFYDKSKQLRLNENSNGTSLEPLVNHDLVVTTMVPLSPEVKDLVYDSLLEQMETWCNCELEGTSFYGIREYYKGNVLRNHVDRVETLVISSILQIHQDLGENKQEWNLEIIRYDGIRDHITLKEGEMLLYESATLVHGRPTPFQGELYANCFLHYRPRNGWEWKRTDDEWGHHVLTDEVVFERTDVINTPLTTPIDHEQDLGFDHGHLSDEL